MGGCHVILFGTGGVRGIMRDGEFDEKLIVDVSRAVALWMYEEKLDGVVIAYDTRRNSNRFAKLAAQTFADCGIETYLFDAPTPTPLLSFAVRELRVGAGVVITASHNPPQYNGYKVYTSDGVQAVPSYTEKISSLMGKSFRVNKTARVQPVPKQVEERYIERLVQLVRKHVEGSTKIVYSPLQGTGARFVPKVLRELGCDVICVEQQMEFDPNFSKVASLNPEDERAFDMVRRVCQEEKARFGIATDPDCDRVGLIVDGKRLSGNQVGVLLTEMLRHGANPESNLIKTIVTTDMVKPMCEELNLHVLETPTGFKYIGHLIETKSKDPSFSYFLAFEESCGYLMGDLVRDKDGVLGSALIAGLCSKYDPIELLNSLYERYGYHVEELISMSFESPEQAKQKYEVLKLNPPTRIADQEIVRIFDYENDPQMPNETLLFETGSVKIYVRPSGTEPKLKIYVKVVGYDEHEARSILGSVRKAVMEL